MISVFGTDASTCTAMCGYPCGATGMWNADASAAILRYSVIPPDTTVSRFRMSAEFAWIRSRAPHRVNSFSPATIGMSSAFFTSAQPAKSSGSTGSSNQSARGSPSR